MSIFEAAISLLAPTECISCGSEGSALCYSCSAKFIQPFGERCWRCNSLSPDCRTCLSCRHTKGPKHVWIVTDHNNIARDLLSVYKFGHQRAAVEPIARLMSGAFMKYNGLPLSDYLIVPVPTATSRIRQRGFGHSELLAKKLSQKLGLPHVSALRRLDQTRQLGSRREDRLKQLSSSFAIRTSIVAGRQILLIDDVITTGGTLIAATKTLRAAGAKRVDALLLAKRL